MGKGRKAILTCLAQLKSENYIDRSIAVKRLVEIGKAAVPFLKEAAKSEISHEAYSAKEALRRLSACDAEKASIRDESAAHGWLLKRLFERLFAQWYVLEKDKGKQGPFTRSQLRIRYGQQHQDAELKICKGSYGEWHTWTNPQLGPPKIKSAKKSSEKVEAQKNYNVKDALRDPSKLASDRSLRCAKCGKQPLLKKRDIPGGGLVAFRGMSHMTQSQQEIQKIFDATAHMRAVRCTSCGRVYCFNCGMTYGRKRSGGAKGCLQCGAQLNIVL